MINPVIFYPNEQGVHFYRGGDKLGMIERDDIPEELVRMTTAYAAAEDYAICGGAEIVPHCQLRYLIKDCAAALLGR